MDRRLIVLMGVAGSGKTTIGKALHETIGGHFVEADDFHSNANIEKMSSGSPLTDQDRLDWIRTIVDHLNQRDEPVLILACSALTAFVQTELRRVTNCKITWLHLEASKTLIEDRMKQRDHFMPESLLESQFADLAPPPEAISINSAQPVEEIIRTCKEVLRIEGGSWCDITPPP